MHPRIILAIARKDMLDVLRNRATLMALLTPIFVAALYWLLSAAIGSSTTTIAIYNPSHSALVSKENLAPLTTWNIIEAPSADAVRSMVDNNEREVTIGITVPPDADAAMKRGERPQVQVFFHAAKVGQTQRQMVLGSLISASQQIAGQQPPVAVQPTLLRLPPDEAAEDAAGANVMNRLSSTLGMAALLVALVSAGMLLVPTLLVEEKEKKTLRMILASPASYGDVIAGKLLVGFSYTMLLSTVMLVFSRMPAAALPQLIFFTVLGGIFFLLVGLALAAFSKTMTEVNTYGSLVFMLALIPLMLNMPGMDVLSGVFGGIVRLIPNYYMIDGMRRALEGTANLESFLFNAGVTVAMIVVLFGLATWLLRRQQLSAA
jgi:ABC-2 type transport system permease protein